MGRVARVYLMVVSVLNGFAGLVCGAMLIAQPDGHLLQMGALLPVMRSWAMSGDRLAQRAAVAALCEPPLLHDPANAGEVVAILDALTTTLVAAVDRRTDAYRVLRQALGYGWSVAIVAAPEPGWVAFERWAADRDPDIGWMVRENLRKHRLQRLDPARVERLAG